MPRHGNTGLILASVNGQAHIVRWVPLCALPILSLSNFQLIVSSHLTEVDDDPVHINASNEAGRTALMVAVDKGRRRVVEILINHPNCIASITDKWVSN